ncbi:MAG: pseudaminic acid synthase [Patescibacteria group bacterium]|nr:pseudaminic acid synthase [Patescibacteria group bacterium]MDD5294875.1 pseudaminic acid synthase [Patescibacteria group bacterium]MDD5554645.1 pseudaminic acid synthase [Patescibacteria group bacterium]
MVKPIIIKTPRGKRKIGPGNPVFIVAEMSGNHLGSYKRALKIIDAAAEAGADAIKLQTYTPDTITLNCRNKYFKIKKGKLWRGYDLYDLYQEAHMPWAWQPKLKKYAEKRGLVLFSFPLDATAVDFLEKIKVELYKVGSFEVVDIPLLKRVGQTRKPVIISRGMSSLEELKLAIKTLKDNGTPQLIILQCVNAYPSNPAEMNLKLIPNIIRRFKVICGLSDHNLTNVTAIAAVALGASVVEKHLILSRSDGGPDAAFSLEPNEFKDLVKSIRLTEMALGRSEYAPAKQEKESIIFRKSLFAVEDIKAGERLTGKNIRSIRPGYGLMPKYYDKVIGRKAKINIKRGTPLSWNLIKR